MPIQVSDFKTLPAVSLDRVHCVELRINLTEEQDSKAKVRIVTRMYGHDAEGVKHFAPEQTTLLIEDAYAQAYEDAAQGDMALASALGAIEAAIAAILTKQGQAAQVV